MTKAYYRLDINRISYRMSEVRDVCSEYYGEHVVQGESYVFIIVIMCIPNQSMWIYVDVFNIFFITMIYSILTILLCYTVRIDINGVFFRNKQRFICDIMAA